MTPPRFRVLIADDDAVTRHLVQFAVQASGVGARVDFALDGEEALQRLRSAAARDDAYDLLLTDHHMPGLDGADLLQLARDASPRTARAMITADPCEAVLRRAGLGSLRLFDKPVAILEIAAFVRHMAEAKGA